MAQRNYMINTTTLSTTASGTTITSGNTQSATFVVARTLVRTGIGAGEFASGSQTWSIHYVVSAMATPYEMRLKVQRRNSSQVVQAESGYGTTRSSTGTYDDNLTADLGTWAANDELALVWEHRRPSGTGNKSGTIDANGASYLDAPVATTPLTQTASDDLAGQADAHVEVLGLRTEFADDANNLADAHVEVLGLLVSLSDNANNLADYFTYGKRPRWQDAQQIIEGLVLTFGEDANNLADAFAKTLGSESAERTVTAADDLNSPWQDNYTQILEYRLSFSDQITQSDSIGLGYGLLFSENANNFNEAIALNESYLIPFSDSFTLTDAYGQIEGQFTSFSDNLNILADATGITEGQHVPFSDSFSLSDGCGLGHGLGCEDQLSLSDSIFLNFGYFLSLSDSLDFLADQISFSGGDLIVQDSFTLSDGLQIALGLRIGLSDNVNNLSDAVLYFIPRAGWVVRVKKETRSVKVEP